MAQVDVLDMIFQVLEDSAKNLQSCRTWETYAVETNGMINSLTGIVAGAKLMMKEERTNDRGPKEDNRSRKCNE